MPMQMPSTGAPVAGGTRAGDRRSRADSISSMVAPNAPSPGTTSASRVPRGPRASSASTASAPTWRNALSTLPRLPMP